MKKIKEPGGREIKNKKPINKKVLLSVAIVAAAIIIACIVVLSLWRAGAFEKEEAVLYTHDVQGGFKEYYIEGENYPGTYAVMTVTDGTNTVEAEIYLLENLAPITVDNFISYAKEGFYDGTAIHRIVDSTYTFQGGSYVYSEERYIKKENDKNAIVGEFKNNISGDYDYNRISHFAGSISMARTSVENSATSGFFISWEDYSKWDGDYAAFGFIVDKEDIEAIKEMATKVEKDADGFPDSPITVTKIEIVEKK